MNPECPEVALLARYIGDEISALQRESIDLHLKSCDPCRETVFELSSVENTVLDDTGVQLQSQVAATAKAWSDGKSTWDTNCSSDLETFVAKLIESTLMTSNEVRAAQQKYASNDDDRAQPLTDGLIAEGRLSPYQVRQIDRGETDILVFGDYVAVDLIGSGGMGLILKARHQRMDRIVALKTLPEGAIDGDVAVKRFQREVKAVAQLEHPNIVYAYFASEHDGRHYLVMEYVAGVDLAELVKENGRLSPEHAVDYITQAADGLSYAHGKGLIHRDVKPSNLMLTDSETETEKRTIKILDLGLARWSDGSESQNLTMTQEVLGSVDYMSPEQAADTRQADARSDVYSLGCTLYFLLSGKKLYDGESALDKMMQHTGSEIPDIRDERDDVSPELALALKMMVAKSPSDRPQSMDAVVELLRPFTNTKDTVVTTSSSALLRKNLDLHSSWWMVAAGVIVPLVILFGAYRYSKTLNKQASVTTSLVAESAEASSLRDEPAAPSDLRQKEIAAATIEEYSPTLAKQSSGPEAAQVDSVASFESPEPGKVELAESTDDVLESTKQSAPENASIQPIDDAPEHVDCHQLAKWIHDHGGDFATVRHGRFFPDQETPESDFVINSVRIPEISDQDVKELCGMLIHKQNCTRLFIDGGHKQRLTDRGIRHAVELTQLRALLVGTVKMTDDSIRHFSKLPMLNTVGLDKVNLTSEIVGSLKNIRQLSSLEMYPLSVSPQAIEPFGELTGLRRLGINFDSIDGKLLTQVDRMQLRDLAVRELDSARYFEFIARSKTIQNLTLYHCDDTNASIMSFKAMTQLRRLNLNRSKANAAGAQALISEVPKLMIAINGFPVTKP